VLVLLIDPISSPQFNRLLPRTFSLLKRLGYTQYDRYSVVGPNSGPNQAALYAGKALESREEMSDGKNRMRWIWDRLRQERGCVTPPPPPPFLPSPPSFHPFIHLLLSTLLLSSTRLLTQVHDA
jgi:hypothetical protein